MLKNWAKTIGLLLVFALFVLLTTLQFVDAFGNLFDLVVAVASLAVAILFGVKLKRSIVQLMADASKDQAQTNPPYSDTEPVITELNVNELFPNAVDLVLETKQASVSMIQRHLKVGYVRASIIMDEMEEKGIVGPFVGSKPRQILITKDQWERMKEANSQRSDEFDANAFYQYIKDNPENFQRVDTDSEMAAFLREYTLEREIRTSVKGVTFRNDDGSNRQSILARCHRGDSIAPMFYYYNGDPACAVITDYGQIGHLSADLAQDIHDSYADYMINGEILAVTGGDAGRNLGCNIVLRLYRKIQK